jgi:hypothetical protein
MTTKKTKKDEELKKNDEEVKNEEIDTEGIVKCILWSNRVGIIVDNLREHGIPATENTELIRFIIDKAFPDNEEDMIYSGASAIGFHSDSAEVYVSEEDVIYEKR